MYVCWICSVDDICCFCSKCFDVMDYMGYMVRINILFGNSGCCDCGDVEVWKRFVFCMIYLVWEGEDKGKGKVNIGVLEDFFVSI